MTTEAMTAEQLAVIQRRTNQTSRGPWYVFENDRYLLVRDRDGNAVCRVSDIEFATPKQQRYAEFIAHARSDIPALVEALRDAREQRDAFERDYTAVGERNRELHDQLFALHATFLACEQRAGEAEARAEAMAKMLAAGCETVLDGRLDRFWAMGADAMARRVVEFTPPRAGEEEPPATATTDGGEMARLREIVQEIEPRMVTVLHDQETPLYGCRDCHRVGYDTAPNMEHAAWCIVTMARAALAAAPPARRVDGGGAEERVRDLVGFAAWVLDEAISAGKSFRQLGYLGRRAAEVAGLDIDAAVAARAALAPASGAGPAVTPAVQRETDRERQLREYVSVEARILRRQYPGRDGHILDAIERLERVVTFQSAAARADAGGTE